LGEVVYAKRYRHYCGRYVFEMEKQFEIALKETRMILLYTSNTHMLQDDGKSHDFTKRNEEQEDFLDAFERSRIENKFMFDVYNSFSETYHSRDYIAAKVIDWLQQKY